MQPLFRRNAHFMALAGEVEKITNYRGWTPLFFRGRDLAEVYVVGDFSNWQKQKDCKLKKVGEDVWTINLALEKGQYRYKFVAGDDWLADPYNKQVETDPFGGKNSLLFVE